MCNTQLPNKTSIIFVLDILFVVLFQQEYKVSHKFEDTEIRIFVYDTEIRIIYEISESVY